MVSEAIVVLSPNNAGQEDIERGYLDTPFHLETLLNPLAMLRIVSPCRKSRRRRGCSNLVHHAIDNVNERLVAGKESVTTRQNVALQPPLAGML